MNAFFAIFIARTKEYYRDRGQLIWSIIFPTLIITGFAFAFSGDQETIFKVGVYQTGSNKTQPNLDVLNSSFTQTVVYQDLDKAIKHLRHHQLHLLISNEAPYRYWINPQSSQGQVLELLLNKEKQLALEKQEVIGQSIRYVDWVLPGVLSMNIMFGSLFGVGFVIVRYRKNGVLKRLHATPLNALQFLAAQMASRIMIVLIACSIIFGGAKLSLDIMMLGSYLDLLVVVVLGTIAMVSLGLLLSTRTDSEELANGMLNVSTWPMLFLSDVFFSLDDAPILMQQLAQCLPLTHLVKAGREIMLNGASLSALSGHLIALVLMIVVFLSLSTVLFRWHR